MLSDQLDRGSQEVRPEAARLLDEISRPMTLKELEEAFRLQGFTRSQRRPFVRALKHLAIIAIVPERAG